MLEDLVERGCRRIEEVATRAGFLIRKFWKVQPAGCWRQLYIPEAERKIFEEVRKEAFGFIAESAAHGSSSQEVELSVEHLPKLKKEYTPRGIRDLFRISKAAREKGLEELLEKRGVVVMVLRVPKFGTPPREPYIAPLFREEGKIQTSTYESFRGVIKRLYVSWAAVRYEFPEDITEEEMDRILGAIEATLTGTAKIIKEELGII